jgi:hypothetical protein
MADRYLAPESGSEALSAGDGNREEERHRQVSKETELIALATVYQDGKTVRGKIPTPVVKALKAKGGEVLAFERQEDGTMIVSKATAAERKTPIKSLVPKKGTKR